MDQFLQYITDGVTFLANGLLIVLYTIWDLGPHLISIGIAAVLVVTFDRLAQNEAAFAPGRYGGVTPARVSRVAQTTTVAALALWLVATFALPAPVPQIGAVMWCLALVALTMMPQQRWSLLWNTKSGLVVYSLAILGYRFFLWQAGQLSPSDLASVFGGSGTAAQVISNNLGTVRTVGTWLLWAVLPAGYCWILIQNWAAQPMSVVNPFAGAADVIALMIAGSRRATLGRVSVCCGWPL